MKLLSGAALLAVAWTGHATPILCEDATLNHMFVDDSQVSSCLGAGVGNINGNLFTDDFLLDGGTAAGWLDAGDGKFTQDGDSGTWTIGGDFWNNYATGAIGFKFGTGNQPDEWFVYELIDGVVAGSWDFVNVFERGGGLSHIQLYYGAERNVPEPGTIALLLVGIAAVGLARRTQKSA